MPLYQRTVAGMHIHRSLLGYTVAYDNRSHAVGSAKKVSSAPSVWEWSLFKGDARGRTGTLVEAVEAIRDNTSHPGKDADD